MAWRWLVMRRRSTLKAIVIVGVIMLLEGIAVFAFVALMGSSPQSARAGLVGGEEVERERLIEIEVLSDRLQNMSTNRVWMWETEVFIKVRQKNREAVENHLKLHRAEIHEGIARIFRRAQHGHLKEPGLETISRQLTAYLQGIFGTDAGENPYVERVVLPKCRGFPADY